MSKPRPRERSATLGRHSWRGRRQATLAELRAEPLIVREPGSGSREALEHALAEVGTGLADLSVIAELGSTGAIKQAVAISLFLEHQLLTLILAIYVMVTLVDALSGWLRRRVV